jgi:hypothetical protein
MRRPTLFVTCVFALCSGCGGANQPRKYSSPEEVFEAAAQAGTARDVATLVHCYSEESQRSWAGTLVQAVTYFEDAKDREHLEPDLSEALNVMERHGVRRGAALREDLPPDHPERGLVRDVKNCAALIMELEPLVGRMEFADGGNLPDLFDFERLMEVKREGDIAIGRATVRGGGDVEDIHFVKQGDGWRIDFYKVEPAVAKRERERVWEKEGPKGEK